MKLTSYQNVDISKGGIVKKIYLVLIGLLVLFPGAVSAADRTCEYGDDDVTITVIFNENKVTYNFRDKNHNGGLLSDTADFDVNKFNNSCSENIYYTIIETANGFGPNNRKFEFSSEDGSISLNLLASSDGDNAAEHLPREYEDDKINVNLTIDNGKFNMQFST